MASHRKRKKKELAELRQSAEDRRQALLREEAENYMILAAETTDPDVKQGAEQLARLKNRSATGRPMVEALQDPDGKPTPQTRKAREAYRERFPDS